MTITTVDQRAGPKQVFNEFAFRKDKNSIPNLEHMKCNLHYAITINPSDVYQEWATIQPEVRVQNFTEKVDEYILSYLRPAHYKLNLELSKAQRLHYHGTIVFPNIRILGLVYSMLYRLERECTLVIKEIDSWEWKLYYIKQRHIMFNLSPTNHKVKYPNGPMKRNELFEKLKAQTIYLTA